MRSATVCIAFQLGLHCVPARFLLHFQRKDLARTVEKQYLSDLKRDKMRKKSGTIMLILIIVVIGATMTLTCPDTQTHKERLSGMVATSARGAMNDMVGSNDLIGIGLQFVGGVVIDKVADTAVDNLLQVDNYVVCSTGRVSYSGEDHIVSIGLLGHVFTINQDKLNEAAKKVIRDVFSGSAPTGDDQRSR